ARVEQRLRVWRVIAHVDAAYARLAKRCQQPGDVLLRLRVVAGTTRRIVDGLLHVDHQECRIVPFPVRHAGTSSSWVSQRLKYSGSPIWSYHGCSANAARRRTLM